MRLSPMRNLTRAARMPLFALLAFFVFALFTVPPEGSEKKRVAYIEAGPFWLYSHTYRAIREALAGNPRFSVEYPEELHVSPGWDAPPGELDNLARALQDRGDIDLIIAGGTAAIRSLLLVNSGRIPIIGIGMADPLAAGVVKSVDDSGVDNFTCEVIPDRWMQMLRVFHDVVGFKRLGVLLPPGPEGRFYAGIDDVLAVGEELDFAVLIGEIPDESVQSCADGVDWLAGQKADAFFIGPLLGFDWEGGDPEFLLDRLNRVHQLPTFARDGSIFVQGGALLGFATWDFSRDGRRLAEKAVRIFDGEKPRSIPMRAVVEPLIAINLQTAMEIDFDLPFDVLIAADEIYVTSERPKLE
ncbi:MAG: hypothetical protein LBT97_05535 [Planctomycetota bacterium]|nr:hypothetical protein [Planctomycetota bacterium]